jgi:leader peptidase (prepilin peptidase)/N-methyltransferase
MLGLIFVGLLGLVVGSFLNVVIHRVPRDESLAAPPSRCPTCGIAIRPRHNVPLFGWLALRGRCAACGAPISVRYPLVEAGTAVVFVALTLRVAALGQAKALPAFLYFAAVGLALALIDLDTRRLPNRVVLPSYAVLAVLLAGAAWWQGDGWAFGRAVLGGAALYAFFFAIVFVYPAGMGFGDVKLAGLVGAILAWLSWGTLVLGAFAGFLLGAIVGLVLIGLGRGGRKTAVPFGPFMVAGALLAIFIAAPVADWYTGLLT